MTPSIDPKLANFKLELIPSSIHRHGVITREKITARSYVIEYTGKLLNRKEHKTLSDSNPEFTYTWQINDYWSIDGAEGGSGAEFINHSCNPNLRVRFHGKRVFYVAIRRIKKGEELTIDYNFDPSDDPVFCLCKTKQCRGTINSK